MEAMDLLYKHVIADLSDPHYRVRAVCLRVFSLFPFIFNTIQNRPPLANDINVQKVIGKYVRDDEPRVRKVRPTTVDIIQDKLISFSFILERVGCFGGYAITRYIS